MNKQIVFPIAFALMVLAQIYVPGKMIWDNERIWSEGSTHLFRTAPVDPLDIFRGKYINLYFDANNVEVEDESEWDVGEQVFGVLSKDEAGFSSINSVAKERPPIETEYLTLTIDYVTDDGRNEVILGFPFDRFYMEESKAYQAELSYHESQRDSTSTTYVVVAVKDGEAVIKNVLIDGVPISEVVQTTGENTD